MTLHCQYLRILIEFESFQMQTLGKNAEIDASDAAERASRACAWCHEKSVYVINEDHEQKTEVLEIGL